MEWILESKMLIIATTIIIIGVGKKFENKLYISALFLYISTVLHELAHYIVGKILFLNIKGGRFFPTLTKDLNGKYDLKVPSVSFEEKPGQGFRIIPMAMSPLFLLYIAYYIETNWFIFINAQTVFEYCLSLFLLIYILTILIYNAIPSWTDLSYLLAFPFSAISWLVIVIMTFAFCNKDFLNFILYYFN